MKTLTRKEIIGGGLFLFNVMLSIGVICYVKSLYNIDLFPNIDFPFDNIVRGILTTMQLW